SVTPRVLLGKRDESKGREQAAACRVLLRTAKTQSTQRGEAQYKAVLNMVASEAKRLNRRSDIPVVDLGVLDLLCILAGGCFCRAPAALALENFYFSEHPQRIDSTTSTPARRLNFDFTGSLVHNHVFDGNINCHDFGD